MNDLFELDGAYVAGTYSRLPVAFARGEGATLYDGDGNAYTDLGSGIAVNGLGLCDAGWVAAVSAQAATLSHTSNLYYTAPQALLAKALCERTGMARVFFGNSGAEANECAIKVARKYANDAFGEGARPTIITLEGSFHGRTVTTLAATGQTAFHHDFGPFTPGFRHVPPGDLPAMARALEAGDVCGVLIELVQGEGGVNVLSQDYARGVEALCRAHGALLMIDEVQTGNGRCGALYAYQCYGLSPDVVTTAKGLAGGLPMGAALLGARVRDTLGPGSHGSTFGGNPICAAGALYVLSRIDDALLRAVRRKHDLIVSLLAGAPGVKSVDGLGLMLGIDCEKNAADVLRQCLARRVVVLTAKHKVRLLPALTIPEEQLTEAITILKEVLAA